MANQKPQGSEERLEELATRILIRGLERDFDRTGSGIFVWKAYRELRRASKDLPAWVIAYFDDCAKNLCELASRGSWPEEGDDVEDGPLAIGTTDLGIIGSAPEQDKRIAEAIGLGRVKSRSALHRLAIERRDKDLACRVRELIDVDGITTSTAAESVAATAKLDRKTVKAAFDRWDPVFRMPLSEFLNS